MTIIERRTLTPRQVEFLDGLRELVVHIERHPELIPDHGGVRVEQYVYPPFGTDEDERRDVTLELMRPLVDAVKASASLGEVLKEDSDYTFGIRRRFGPHQIAVLTPASNTCEFEDTGEVEEVEVLEIPAEVRAQYKRTETRPIMRKHCPKFFEGAEL